METLQRDCQRVVQNAISQERRPTIAMRYADNPTEMQSRAKRKSHPKIKDLTGKTRDSESYGSLHSDQQSGDDPYPLTQKPTEPATSQPSSRNVRSNFCNLL
nr:PREDICTED: uncharacterized protein LOC102349899 [Latimeria chalumnae]|eukprot:XP_014342171.1 PREDICTED: uncharacterized protein LOC102349899 [Latimeria chalumnae]